MMARLLGVSGRTARRWKRAAAEQPRPRGRPRLRPALSAVRAIARAWRAQGKGTGWRPVWHALKHVSRRLVQRVVAEIKRRRRARRRRREEALRVSIRVSGRGVLWSLDATHLGREACGAEVQGQAVREVASTRTLALTVAGAVDAADAIAIVRAAATVRGGRYPLVLVTDNGAPYVSERFTSFLAAHGVMPLRSLPHTPRHNPWVERGHRDLKEESGLGKGVLLDGHAGAARRLAAAAARLDGQRLRRVLGYRTALAVDAELAVPYDEPVRAELAQLVRTRIQQGAQDRMSKRARRVLRREAILAALEELNLIERTRGGRPLRAVKQEVIS